MKIRWYIIEWGRSPKYPDVYSYYFGWSFLKPSEWATWYEGGKLQWFTTSTFWYDGPHKTLNIGPLLISWRTKWTRHEEEDE